MSDQRTVIVDHLLAERIGWQEGYPPFSAHADHIYNGGCAVCRTDERDGLDAVADAALDALALAGLIVVPKPDGWVDGRLLRVLTERASATGPSDMRGAEHPTSGYLGPEDAA